jgi:hypothetical protein
VGGGGYERQCSSSPIEGLLLNIWTFWMVYYRNQGNRCETQTSFKMKIFMNHLELSRMFSTVIQARSIFHFKERLLVIIGKTWFLQKITVTLYWGWWSGGQNAKSARPVSRGAKRRTPLPWPTQSGATIASIRINMVFQFLT